MIRNMSKHVNLPEYSNKVPTTLTTGNLIIFILNLSNILVNRQQINKMREEGKLFVIHENYICDVIRFVNNI